MEEILELAQLLVAANEWGFQSLGAPDAAPLGDDAEGVPGRDRTDLALEHLVGRGLESDRTRGRALGRLADQHRGGSRRTLEAARRVDHVARDHALVRGPERDCGLARQDPDPNLDSRSE